LKKYQGELEGKEEYTRVFLNWLIGIPITIFQSLNFCVAFAEVLHFGKPGLKVSAIG